MGLGRGDGNLKSLRGPIGLSILITALTLAGVGITWEWLFQRTSDRSAIQEFGRTHTVGARAVLNPFTVDGEPQALERLSSATNSLIREGGAVHVSAWSEAGKLLWSDLHDVVGHETEIGAEDLSHEIDFDAEERALLDSQGTQVEFRALAADEPSLLAVDFGSMTPSGHPVVVEVFYPADLLSGLAADERDRFRPLLLVG